MKRKKKKPTTEEVLDLIFKAVTAIAALIGALRWW